jgi:hypothetical protein
MTKKIKNRVTYNRLKLRRSPVTEAVDIVDRYGNNFYTASLIASDVNKVYLFGAVPAATASGVGLDPRSFGSGTLDDPFLLLIFTPFTLRRLENVVQSMGGDASRVFLALDATHKVNLKGFQLLAIGVVDKGHRFHLMAHAIMSHKSATCYEYVLQAFKNVLESANVGCGHPVCFTLCMTDAEDALHIGLKRVFPGIRGLMCWFHVTQALKRYLNKLRIHHLRHRIFNFMYSMHFARGTPDFTV